MAKITVLGAGGWGLAMGIMADRHGHNVSIWSSIPEEVETLNRDREHKKLLPGITISDSIAITSELQAVAEADLLLMAVPSFAVRSVSAQISSSVRPEQMIVNICKGFDEEKLVSLSEVVLQEIPQARVAVLSGPSHAEEVARGAPTTVCVSARTRQDAEWIQETLMNPDFRIYTTPDMIGVELGGALKNVIALAAGIIDGMKLGDNPKAALMTRGLTEMARLGVAMGGRAETFAGLSGAGDLIVTCMSMHSRNRRAGILIGQGTPPAEAVAQIGTVEGYSASRLAYKIARRENVDMPIVMAVYAILYESRSVSDAISELMSRSKKHEVESVWLKQIDW
jgi:glycerol-3-phosphate dehydrogenase (NAD(P)+)